MIVIMKALSSCYNREVSTIYEAQNTKVLCVFKNLAYFLFFSVQYAYFFDHSTSTTATAGLVAGELVPDMVY